MSKKFDENSKCCRLVSFSFNLTNNVLRVHTAQSTKFLTIIKFDVLF